MTVERLPGRAGVAAWRLAKGRVGGDGRVGGVTPRHVTRVEDSPHGGEVTENIPTIPTIPTNKPEQQPRPGDRTSDRFELSESENPCPPPSPGA